MNADSGQMNMREPFAKVVILSPEDDSGQEARALFVGGVEVCSYPFWESDGEDPIESYVVRINAAHEARVKEEVRKAVEEFRERAVIVVRAGWRNVPDGGGDCVVRIMDLEEKIGNLPTEPEDKK